MLQGALRGSSLFLYKKATISTKPLIDDRTTLRHITVANDGTINEKNRMHEKAHTTDSYNSTK